MPAAPLRLKGAIGEVLGTFMFVSVVLQEGTAIPVGIGLAAAVLAFGHICHANFNPAITLMQLARGVLSAPAAAVYVLMQVAGALLAWYVFDGMTPSKSAK
jgi:glycerol uptake facilitator-like aquaporin